MISTQLKVIFVDIPKTSSTSLRRFLIRSFHPYYFNSITDPTWMGSLCSFGNAPYVLSKNGGIAPISVIRHEPMISIYKNTSDYIHECFIFSITRDPFLRFKSFVLEQLLFSYYDVNYRSQTFFQKKTSDQFLIDPGYLPSHYPVFKKLTGWNPDQVIINFLHKTLGRINNKGGFANFNMCDIDLHLWPQYMYLKLNHPKPLPLNILNFENIEYDFEILKGDLSSFTGVDVMNSSLPHADPLPEMVYLGINPSAKQEMKEYLGIIHEQEWEGKETIATNPYHLEIAKKFPTYSSFLEEHKKIKKQFDAFVTPILENDFRELVERMYDEDYRMLGYTKGS